MGHDEKEQQQEHATEPSLRAVMYVRISDDPEGTERGVDRQEADTDSDVAMARVLVAMANKSSADTARRVARAAKQQAIEGTWHGGRVPFGYQAESGTLVVDPVTGPMVAEAAQRVLAGESLYRIEKDWNERGVLTTHRCAWSDRTLKLMLRNPSIKGVREYRPMLPDGTRAKTSLMQVKVVWPAILDEDTWQQVCDVLDAHKQARNFHQPGIGAAKRLYPFSGLIRCSDCGRPMLHRGGVYQCVQSTRGGCNRSIRSADITKLVEEAVLTTFEQITLDPTTRTRPSVDAGARVGLAARLDADRERLARLDDDHYDGLIDKAMWVRQRARIAERIEATRREYTAAMPEHAGPGIDMTTVAAEWAGRTPMWQYQATSLILEAVLVHGLPDGINGATPPRRRNESVEAFHARRELYPGGYPRPPG